MNWKGQLAQILAFTVAPALGVIAAWLALRHPVVTRWSSRAFRRWTVVLWLLTRVGTFLVVFPLFRYAGGHDLVDVWFPIARAVLHGSDPTPLVDNLYGPLFPHVLASGLFLGAGRYAPAIDAPFLLADALGILLLHRIARRHLPEGSARRVVLFYLLSPVLWHGAVVRTQEEPLFVLFLLGSLDLLDRKREFAGCVAASLGTIFTKALFPFWALPLLLLSEGRRRRVAVAGGLTLLGLLLAVALGWDPLTRLHPSLSVRGCSSWLLFLTDQPARPWFLAGLSVTALGCVVAAGAALRLRPGESAVDRAARGVVTVQAAFFVLSPFALPPHLAHALPFLAWQVVREGAARRDASLPTLLYAGAVCVWQFPALRLNSEHWVLFWPLIALFVLFSVWSGLRALFRKWESPE